MSVLAFLCIEGATGVGNVIFTLPTDEGRTAVLRSLLERVVTCDGRAEFSHPKGLKDQTDDGVLNAS